MPVPAIGLRPKPGETWRHVGAGFAVVVTGVTTVIVGLQVRLPPQAVYLASGALFGAVHSWGVPGGLAGVVAAGFLGWLLTKSIGETGGLGWAWFRHFLQDVVILSALFAAVP